MFYRRSRYVSVRLMYTLCTSTRRPYLSRCWKTAKETATLPYGTHFYHHQQWSGGGAEERHLKTRPSRNRSISGRVRQAHFTARGNHKLVQCGTRNVRASVRDAFEPEQGVPSVCSRTRVRPARGMGALEKRLEFMHLSGAIYQHFNSPGRMGTPGPRVWSRCLLCCLLCIHSQRKCK